MCKRKKSAAARARRDETALLRREVSRLRRENKDLMRLVELKASDPDGGRPVEALTYQGAIHRLMNSSSYLSYLGSFISASSPWRVWNRMLKYSRRFTFLSSLLRISARVVAIIEASAVLLLVASAAIILIPVLLVLALVTLLLTLIENRKMTREITEAVAKRKVYIFFPAERKQLKTSSFYYGTLAALADKPENTVIVVSPSVLSDSTSAFLSARQKGQRFFLIRRHLFFRLRDTLLCSPASVTYIY